MHAHEGERALMHSYAHACYTESLEYTCQTITNPPINADYSASS